MRREWPLTGGPSVTPDSPPGHVRNALATLRAFRQCAPLADAPTSADVKRLLLGVEARLEQAIVGLDQIGLAEPRLSGAAPRDHDLAEAPAAGSPAELVTGHNARPWPR